MSNACIQTILVNLTILASESDEVHTLELPLLIFITLSTAWCNLNVFGTVRLSPNLSFFGGG